MRLKSWISKLRVLDKNEAPRVFKRHTDFSYIATLLLQNSTNLYTFVNAHHLSCICVVLILHNL